MTKIPQIPPSSDARLKALMVEVEADEFLDKLSPSQRSLVESYVTQFTTRGTLSERQVEILQDIVEQHNASRRSPKTGSRRYEGFRGGRD